VTHLQEIDNLRSQPGNTRLALDSLSVGDQCRFINKLNVRSCKTGCGSFEARVIHSDGILTCFSSRLPTNPT
jgi:hypothetical protein